MKRLFSHSKFISIFIATSLTAGCVNIPLPTAMSGVNNPNAPMAGVATNQRNMSIPYRLIDRDIQRVAKANIYSKYPSLKFDSRIEVDSFYGNVLLTGEVPNEKAKKEVQDIFLSMRNVKGLFNELKVSRRRTMSYNLHDAYITSQIRSKILLNKNVRSSRAKIVTESGIVYVMGGLSSVEKQEIIRIVDLTPVVMELIFLTSAK